MATNDVLELADQELVHFLLSQERELVDRRFKHSLNRLENTSSLRDVRRNIARLRTELRAREIATGVGPNTLTRQYRGSFSHELDGSVSAEKGGFLSNVVDKLSSDE
jgi:large subunit ribosomal protein L29